MKKKQKRGENNVIVMCICSLVIIYFISLLYNQQITINNYNSQMEMYQTEITKNNKIQECLISGDENLSEDAFIEKVAREELGLVKPYEKVFIDISQ